MTTANCRAHAGARVVLRRAAQTIALVNFLCSLAMKAEAQSQRAPLPRPTITCGPSALILLRVQDAQGKPVSGAKVKVVRRSDRRLLQRQAQESIPAGEYLLLDDSARPLVARAGTELDVTVRHGRRVVNTVITVGQTPDGCHVRRIGEPRAVTIPTG